MSYKVKDPLSLSIEGQMEVLSGKHAYDNKIKDPLSIECQITVLSGKDAYDNSSVSSGSSQDSQDSRTGLLDNVFPQPKAPQNKNLLWLVTVISLISIVLCAVVVTISLIALKLEVQHGIEESASKPPVVCIECIKIIKNPYNLSEVDPLMDSLDKVFEDGVEKCCAHNNSQLSALIEMSMRLQRVNTAPLPDFNVSDFKFSPVSAHKRLYPPKNPFPEVNYRKRVPRFENSSVYVLFKYEKSMSDPLLEHEHGVEVLNDGLRIVYSGAYYVYSSIHFRPESAHPCKSFLYTTWGHSVEKLSPNSPAQTGCLLKTAHTCCDHCTMDEETSYTGGVFNLEAGDIIRVSVSGHGLVYFRQQTSFAGVFMIGLANP
ncbi:unnamed protein product [Lymnaea stagnalis]|uniref:THD domain-containing protein n=1 Tax=Lymnaea stagnalis TaxID=6523 RepID=A0AAV2GYH8_LYMST